MESVQQAFVWVYNRLPHHPLFLIPFAIFTALKIYCTVCLFIGHVKIRGYRSKTVLINGCEERGYGKLLAVKCLKSGMNVVVTCRNQQSLQYFQNFKVKGKSILASFLMDPTSDVSVADAKEKIQAELAVKGTDLFALVNCDTPVSVGYDSWLNVQDYETSLQQGVLSLIRVIKAFKEMIKESRGRIINLSSAFGKFAQPELTPFCMSQFCVEAYSDALRRELSPFGVKVIVVQAGFFCGSNKVSSAFRERWNGLPADVKEGYPEDFAKKATKRLLSKENSTFHCPWHCWATSSMFNALVSAFPRRRYATVGLDNLLFYSPISLMPTNFQDFFFALFGFLSWFPKAKLKQMGKKDVETSEC